MPATQPDPADPLGFFIDSGGWTVGRFAGLHAVDGVVHAVTTRRGPPFPATVDAPEMGALTGELAGNLNLQGAAWASQVHGDQVLSVNTAGLAGQADGLVTSTPGIGVLGRSADCPLVLLAGHTGDGDSATGSYHVVGMAHASWRSTLKGITSHVVALMQRTWRVAPARITAAICPSAGPCCYEVGEEVREAAIATLGSTARRFFQLRQDKLYFDLWAANAGQLLACGVLSARIHHSGVCTICRNDLFPSYRREGEAAARFAAIIGIAAPTRP